MYVSNDSDQPCVAGSLGVVALPILLCIVSPRNMHSIPFLTLKYLLCTPYPLSISDDSSVYY